METEQVVALFRHSLQMALLIGTPLLLIAVFVSLLVNVVQVLTSLQDQTLSTVPRLLAVGAALFLLMPWMWRQLANYTIKMFSDFHWILN